jgi:hypothetical protein
VCGAQHTRFRDFLGNFGFTPGVLPGSDRHCMRSASHLFEETNHGLAAPRKLGTQMSDQNLDHTPRWRRATFEPAPAMKDGVTAMSENDIPARELAELEAKMRSDPLTREEETHILAQEQRWVDESQIRDEAEALFRYWPRWLIPTLIVCFFIFAFVFVASTRIGLWSP